MKTIPLEERIGEFTYLRFGKTGFIEIYPSQEIHTQGALTMDGTDIEKQIQVPYIHRVCNIKLYHMDASYDPCNDALKCVFERPQSHIPALRKMADQPLRRYDLTSSKKIFAFKDFELAPIRAGIWKLTLNTTTTDLVVPVITIQVLGGSIRELVEKGGLA